MAAAPGVGGEAVDRPGAEPEAGVQVDMRQGRRSQSETRMLPVMRREIAAKTPPVHRPLPDHLPLYRRAGICARQGVELERSTPADWVGASAKRLEPLVRALRDHAPAAGTLQADGYAGFERLYETGRSTEAACRARVRHTFHDLEQAIGVIDSVDGLVLWPSVGTPTP